MNRKLTLTSLGLLLLGFLLINSSNGRATAANEGNTGAPGDVAPAGRTCQNCHLSSAIQVNMGIEVTDLDENPVTAYVPGNTYQVKVKINSVAGTPSAYGFQLVSEIDAGNQSVNTFANPSANAKLVNTSNGRQYAEHKTPSASNEFSVQWTAPAAGTGPVTFYSAGNGVNSNGQSSGDGASKTSFSLPEEAGSSVFEPSRMLQLALAPNPASESIRVSAVDPLLGAYTLRISDRSGRVVTQLSAIAFGGDFAQVIDLGTLPSGHYFLQVLGAGYTAGAPFLKL